MICIIEHKVNTNSSGMKRNCSVSGRGRLDGVDHEPDWPHSSEANAAEGKIWNSYCGFQDIPYNCSNVN